MAFFYGDDDTMTPINLHNVNTAHWLACAGCAALLAGCSGTAQERIAEAADKVREAKASYCERVAEAQDVRERLQEASGLKIDCPTD